MDVRWHTLGELCWYLNEYFKSMMSSWNCYFLAKEGPRALFIKNTTNSRILGWEETCWLNQLSWPGPPWRWAVVKEVELLPGGFGEIFWTAKGSTPLLFDCNRLKSLSLKELYICTWESCRNFVPVLWNACLSNPCWHCSWWERLKQSKLSRIGRWQS